MNCFKCVLFQLNYTQTGKNKCDYVCMNVVECIGMQGSRENGKWIKNQKASNALTQQAGSADFPNKRAFYLDPDDYNFIVRSVSLPIFPSSALCMGTNRSFSPRILRKLRIVAMARLFATTISGASANIIWASKVSKDLSLQTLQKADI